MVPARYMPRNSSRIEECGELHQWMDITLSTP